MAYNFIRANASVISGNAPITDYPLTISCWFNTSLTNTNQILVGLYDTGNISNCALLLRPTALLSVSSRASSSTVFANSSTTYSANLWHHGCGVWSSASSRSVYLNGGNVGTSTASRALYDIVNINLGNSTVIGSVGLQGNIAEIGIWNIALSESDIISLSKNLSPELIHSNNLVFYSPLIREAYDYTGTSNISAINNPAITNHIRIYT